MSRMYRPNRPTTLRESIAYVARLASSPEGDPDRRSAYEVAIDLVSEPRTAKGRQARRVALRNAGVVLEHDSMSARHVPPDDGSRTAEGDCLAFLIDALTRES